MLFGKKETGNIVHINSVDDLKTRKIKPADLNKKFIDKHGQEYKLKYNQLKKKVVIKKVIKGVLDGKFVKDRLDNIAQDEQASEEVKKQLGRMGKEFLEKKYHIDDKHPSYSPPYAGLKDQNQTQEAASSEGEIITSDQSAIKSADDIPIDSITNAYLVIEKLIERLDMALKNILESNVFDERYDYDEKILVEELRSLVKSNIIEEFRNLKEMREDIFKGFSDSKLEKNEDDEELQEILATKTEKEIAPFLRELEGLKIYIERLENIIKTFNEIENKLSNISETKLSSKRFHERQRFSDGKLSLNACKNDAEKILNYFQNTYNKTLSI